MPYPSHPQVVRRALSAIEQHAGEPVAVSALCRAAGVSERTLRNAFHDVHGIAPKEFLLRQGLEQAHQTLLQAHGVRGAVTRAATESGFYELGRFAGAYRDLYGESPSETARRSAEAEAA